jgi:hypothetical protein
VYDSYELEFRKQAHQDWNVLFDPQNLDQVLAVSADSKHRTRTKICTSNWMIEVRMMQWSLKKRLQQTAIQYTSQTEAKIGI